MTPKITLSKNKSEVDPWFTSWYVGDILYFSFYKGGEEHVMQLVDTKGLKALQECLEAAGFKPKYENWFSVGAKNGEYFIEYFERGEETRIQTSYHGAIKLREHFRSLGYEWK